MGLLTTPGSLRDSTEDGEVGLACLAVDGRVGRQTGSARPLDPALSSSGAAVLLPPLDAGVDERIGVGCVLGRTVDEACGPCCLVGLLDGPAVPRTLGLAGLLLTAGLLLVGDLDLCCSVAVDGGSSCCSCC